MDAKTAINLVVAPEVTKKARHMFVSHHYIRSLNEQGVVKPVQVPAPDMRADVMTKYKPPTAFKIARSKLLNLEAVTATE